MIWGRTPPPDYEYDLCNNKGRLERERSHTLKNIFSCVKNEHSIVISISILIIGVVKNITILPPQSVVTLFYGKFPHRVPVSRS